MAGSALCAIGALGMLRFPNFWARLHAASVSESGGVILIILGLILQAGIGLLALKLLAIGILLLITGPTATHAVANAAMVSGLKPTSDIEDIETGD